MKQALTDAFLSGEELYEQSFEGIFLPTLIGKLLATACKFRKISFQKSKLPLDCTDTVFEGCDFSFCKLSDSSLSRCSFIGCDFTGADFSDSFLRDCTFTSCKGDMLNCNQSKLQAVTFTDCRLPDAYIEGCVLKKTTFTCCNLEAAYFTATRLKDIDLTTCVVTKLHLRQEDLHGCKLTLAQAMEFLWMLGIQIKA